MFVLIKLKWRIWTLMGNGLHPKTEYTVKHPLHPKIVQQRQIQLQNNSPSSLPQATKKKFGRFIWNCWLNITWFLGNEAPEIQMVSFGCHLVPTGVWDCLEHQKINEFLWMLNEACRRWKLSIVRKLDQRWTFSPWFFLKCALVLYWLTWAYQVQFTGATLLNFWRLNSLHFKHLSLASICGCQYVKLLCAALMSDTQRGPLKDPLMVPLKEKCLLVLLPCAPGWMAVLSF